MTTETEVIGIEVNEIEIVTEVEIATTTVIMTVVGIETGIEIVTVITTVIGTEIGRKIVIYMIETETETETEIIIAVIEVVIETETDTVIVIGGEVDLLSGAEVESGVIVRETAGIVQSPLTGREGMSALFICHCCASNNPFPKHLGKMITLVLLYGTVA